MTYIRPAKVRDVPRIAEILVFNNRVNYFPIFGDEDYSFGELQVVSVAEKYLADGAALGETFVYDDGIVRGFVQTDGAEVKKLYVDTFFQGRGIGAALLEFAAERGGTRRTLALGAGEKHEGNIVLPPARIFADGRADS